MNSHVGVIYESLGLESEELQRVESEMTKLSSWDFNIFTVSEFIVCGSDCTHIIIYSILIYINTKGYKTLFLKTIYAKG